MASNEIQMAVDTQDESPLFIMGCLSPSKEEAEPPTKKYQQQVESPKCASLLAFSRDDEDDEPADEAFTAASAGLVAAGLAWVRHQSSSPRHASTTTTTSPEDNAKSIYELRCPIEQQLRERLLAQKRLDRLASMGRPSTPSRPPKIDTACTQDNDELQIQSCPTSPSFMSRVYSNLYKMPLSSNTSFNNSKNSSVANSPKNNNDKEEESPQLTPRLNKVNNIYSFSNLIPMTSTPATTPTCSQQKNSLQEPDDATLSYFCQDETTPQKKKKNSKSPSTLSQVLSKIGSYDPDEGSSSQEDSILQDDDDEEDEDEDDIHGISWIPPVRCVAEEGQGVSTILTPPQMHQIARHVLPKGIACCQWKRLYSLLRDGDSFDVCLHYAQHDARTLLVVRTTRGAILGGYASDVWQTKSEGYYGNSDTCLFTFEEQKEEDDDACCENVDPQASTNHASVVKTPTRPTRSAAAAATPLTPQSPPLLQRPKKSLLDADNYEASLPPIRVYRYTGVNRYIQYCDGNKKMMAFGGGGEDGSFGLCVEEEFQGGSTGHCDTFDNQPLCDEHFKIVDVELWGFLSGQF